MKRLPFASLMLLALACGGVAVPPAFAQRDRDQPSASQIADRIDLRIARLKADLRLNDDQNKNWGSVQSALHDIAVNRANRYFQRDEAPRDRNASRDWSAPPRDANAAAPRDTNVAAPRDTNAPPPPRDASDRNRGREPDAMDRMRKEADYLADRANDLRKLADAAGPLYGTLDDGQRRRFVEFLRKDRDDEREMMRDRSR
jgi:hypothetical protein